MTQPLIELRAVERRLGRRVILSDITLACDRGELVAVMGANGSGKSTLLRVAAGALSADAGEVRIGGEPASGARARPAARRRVGYVPDLVDAPPAELTVVELVSLAAALRRAGAADVDPAIERVGLGALRGRPLGALSLGQRRRACLAAAVVGAPPLLLLDEPESGLDGDGVVLLCELLRDHLAAGGAALWATHRLDTAAMLGARLLRLVDGHLVEAATSR